MCIYEFKVRLYGILYFFLSIRSGRGSEDFCKGDIIMLGMESTLVKEKIEEIMC